MGCDQQIIETAHDQVINTDETVNPYWCAKLRTPAIVATMVPISRNFKYDSPNDNYDPSGQYSLELWYNDVLATNCVDQLDGPGWYRCITPTFADQVCIRSNSATSKYLVFSEILAFSETPIQLNAKSVEVLSSGTNFSNFPVT